MTTAAPPGRRPHSLEELKRAWRALEAGEFRASPSAATGTRSQDAHARAAEWIPAAGERTLAVLGCSGSVGASTIALATAMNAPGPVRVVECCSVTSSGLAAASTAELGMHSSGWRRGTRDHVLLERTSEILAGADEVPAPIETEHETQLTILDIGWEAGQLLATECWLADAVRGADQVVLVTSATVPGMRRLEGTLHLLAGTREPEQIVVAVVGPRRKKWPKAVEHSGGPAVRSALAGERCVEIPEDRELAVTGLDSRPVPAPLVAAARQLLEPHHDTDTDPTP